MGTGAPALDQSWGGSSSPRAISTAPIGGARWKRPLAAAPPRPAGRGRARSTDPIPPPACLAASAGTAGAAPRLRASAGRGGDWRPELGAGGADPGRGRRRLRSSTGAAAGRLRGLGRETPREAVTSSGRLGRSVLVAAIAAARKEKR